MRVLTSTNEPDGLYTKKKRIVHIQDSKCNECRADATRRHARHSRHITQMPAILLEIPENIVTQLKFPPKRAQQMLMEELVIRLYEQGIMTAAQGAGLLKMSRLRFEHFLAVREVSIHGEPEELARDLEQRGACYMIVSNTTPLSNFLHLDRLDILRHLFGTIHIPHAVKQEMEEYFRSDARWRTWGN